MVTKYSINLLILCAAFVCLTCSCGTLRTSSTEGQNQEVSASDPIQVIVEAEAFISSSAEFAGVAGDVSYVDITSEGWLGFDVPIEVPGRYRSQVFVSSSSPGASVWIEDYYDNTDGRTYNITGSIPVDVNDRFQGFYVEGSPLNSTSHKMKLHLSQGDLKVDKIVFTLMKHHQMTPVLHRQNMEGDDWHLVWADEFDGDSIDESKWIHDIGNWGWGNNELQYYTENRSENARIEDGHLVIEARKSDLNHPWTSVRMTTRGRQSFLYGKIEMRAKVPREKGNWAAGWTLGDAYVDEISWPYCGEIDILESVGFEVDNESGDGKAHVTVHTPAYYFKIGNQITSTVDVKNMAGEFHRYGVEWTPTEVRGYVDGEHCYTYDKNANDLEWPFNQPQNIILNLAMGGGWGGAQGMDDTVTSQKYLIDYVRVYELR